MTIKRIRRTSISRVLLIATLVSVIILSLNIMRLSSDDIFLEQAIYHYLRSDIYPIKITDHLSAANPNLFRAVMVASAPALHHLLYNFLILIGLSLFVSFRYRSKKTSLVQIRGLRSPLRSSSTKIKLGRGIKNGERWIDSPYTDYTVSIPLPSRPHTHKAGTFSALEVALIHILKENGDIPASIDGHHGSTNLFVHSLSVAKIMQSIAKKKGFEDALIGILGLAHDLEKVIGYIKDAKGKWVRRTPAYHIFGPVILKSLNEFKALPETERICLSRVLAYRHSKALLPMDFSQRQRSLLELLKLADRRATGQEQSAVHDTDENASDDDRLEKAVFKALSELNVNKSLGGETTEGWYSPSDSYFVTTVENVRAHLFTSMDSESIQRLQLGAKIASRGAHPLKTCLVKILRNHDLLLGNIGQVDSDHGVFSGVVKLSNQNKIRLYNILLIKKTEFENIHPGIFDRWGSMVFKLRCTAPS